MTGLAMGCACYIVLGVCIIGFGIRLIVVKRDKPVAFWANVKEQPQVNDISAYNKAVGKLWCGYGAIIVLLGLLMLAGPVGTIATILGTCWASIGLAVIYSVAIMKKYGKNKF